MYAMLSTSLVLSVLARAPQHPLAYGAQTLHLGL